MVLPKYDSRGSSAATAGVSKHSNIRFAGSGNVGRAAAYNGGDPINQSIAEYGSTVSGDITNGAGSLAAVTFNQLRVSQEMKHRFGTSSTPIQIDAETVYVDSNQSEVHLNGTYNRVIVARMPRLMTISGDGATRKGIRELIVIGDRGRINVTNATRIDKIFVYGYGVEVVLDEDCENFSGGAVETGPIEIRVGKGSRIIAGTNSNKIVNAGGYVRFDAATNLIQFSNTASTEFTGSVDTGSLFDGQISAFKDQVGNKLVDVDIFNASIIDKGHGQESNTSGSSPVIHGSVSLRLLSGSTVKVE